MIYWLICAPWFALPVAPVVLGAPVASSTTSADSNRKTRRRSWDATGIPLSLCHDKFFQILVCSQSNIMKYPFHHGDVISYFPFHISGVGKNVPGFGDLFHIAKTNICWKLYAQELGDVKHWDIYQPLSINICHDLPHVFFLIVFFKCC